MRRAPGPFSVSSFQHHLVIDESDVSNTISISRETLTAPSNRIARVRKEQNVNESLRAAVYKKHQAPKGEISHCIQCVK